MSARYGLDLFAIGAAASDARLNTHTPDIGGGWTDFGPNISTDHWIINPSSNGHGTLANRNIATYIGTSGLLNGVVLNKKPRTNRVLAKARLGQSPIAAPKTGLLWRFDPATRNGYALTWEGDASDMLRLSRFDGGLETSLNFQIINGATAVSGDVWPAADIQVRMIGSNIEVNINGSGFSSWATDGTYTNPGQVGLGGRVATSAAFVPLDNFEAWDLGNPILSLI